MGQNFRRQGLGFLALLCLSGASVVPVAAQVLYGSLVGTIEDQSGATVPNAKLSITNTQTGFSRETTSDEGGRYSAASIPGGVYTIKVTANGFKSISRDNVPVSVNAVSRIDLKLEVGAVSDTITVEATAAVLKTDKADTSSEISQKIVQNLALNQYRNYQSLINLVPGATPAAFQNSATDSPGRSLRTNINGTNANNNNTRLDGATNVNIWLPHHVAYVAPSETVEQVNISTSSFDAEQGMAGGAAITVISASGTNALHGALWEYHENQRMRAAPYFGRTATFQKPRYTLNIFGAKAGGAIIKNKLFWFGHYEGTRQGNGATGQFSVPNAAMRTGDFSGFSTVIFDPRTGNPDGTGRSAFPGNIIPANRISPVTNRILPLVPNPNNPTANVTNNLFVNGVGKFDRNNYDGKVNWNRNERHTMFFKFSQLTALVGGVNGLGELVGSGVGGDAGLGDTKQYIGTVGTNYTISPSLLFDANWGMQQMDQQVLGSDFGKNFGTDVFGIPGTNGPDPRYSGLPGFTFNTFSGYGQLNTWMPTFRNDRSFTFTTNLSWIKNKHEFRFGFDMVRHQLNHWQPETANPRGQFSFSGNITANRGGAAGNNLNSYADFLLGQPTGITKSIQNILMTGREWQFGFYARDRWQVTRNLTVNIGVRMERYPLMTRAESGLEKLDPSTNTIRLGGYGNVPTNPGISVDPICFAPRVGIAYKINDSTVFRVGYGMTIDPLPFSRPLRGFYPLVVTSNAVGTSDFDPFRTLSQGIPNLTGPDLSTGLVSLPPTADMRSPLNKINRGYTQSWNATMERRLPGAVILTVGYVGTQSTNLLADLDVNAAPYGAGNAGRPYAAQFGRRIATNMWDGWLSSNYHSLQTSVNRSFSKGLLIKGAYTWSKAINMTDDDGWASVNFNLQSNIGRNRAPAGYDRTQVLQMGWVYELPFGKGRQFLQSGVAAAIAGGWSLNGVYSAYSGTPFTVTANGGPLNTPGSLQTADQVAPVNYIGQKGPGQFYFDPASFRTPAINPAFGPNSTITFFGNSGRNRMRGPGVAKADLTLLRQFNINERMNFQFRAEAYNFTNTPLFNNPAANRDGANFGVVTGTVANSERQFRLGLRFQF
jgi:hypothetical protein